MHAGFHDALGQESFLYESNGYFLEIAAGQTYENWGRVFFSTSLSLVTARDKGEYDYPAKIHVYDPSKQYIEVGAGLGGFVPDLVKLNPRSRPIVIDPVNYFTLHDLLLRAELELPKTVDEDIRSRVSLLRERTETILDSSRVNLINLPLDEALTQYEWLNGFADIVVANRVPKISCLGFQEVLSSLTKNGRGEVLI